GGSRSGSAVGSRRAGRRGAASSCSSGGATVRGRIAVTDEYRAPTPAALASGAVLALVLFLVAAVWASFTIIQPGNVGVVFNRWSGALKTVGQGVAWRIPWITQVQSYPVAVRTSTMVRGGAQ